MNKHIHQAPEHLRLTPAVFAQIKETIGERKAESGGILGGCRETGEVTHFYFDEAPKERNGVAYTPNNAKLNPVIKTEWKPQGIEFLGSIHSHPAFYTHPSPGDETYARRILDAMELPYLLVPIVMTAVDTDAFSLLPFAAVPDGADGVRIVAQDLLVGDELVAVPEHLKRLPRLDDIPWELIALLGGAGLMTFGVIRGLKRYSEREERN